MDDLESKEYAEQRTNQRGQGLKILTLSQMRSRLPISLVQIKTEITNSEKSMWIKSKAGLFLE